MVVQYTSSRGSKAFKIGAALVAIVGAISISNVWKGLRDAGRAMAGSPISTAMLALGFLLVVVAFRDTWLGWFGWMGPHRALRLIKSYLDSQSYSVKVENSAPDFFLIAKDDADRKIGLFWSKTPFKGVLITAILGPGFPENDVWEKATSAELRRLGTRFMDIGTRLDGGGATYEEIGDPDKAKVTYSTLLPRDLLNYEEFFRCVNGVIGCFIVALNEANDLQETVRERLEEQKAAPTAVARCQA